MYINLRQEEEIKKKYFPLYVKHNRGIKKYIRKNFITKYENISNFVKKNNHEYIKKLIEENTFLNDINGLSLDFVQKEIVLSEEENTLVIAGAGSGKTLTILAKIIYLIKTGVNPKEILVLSFTNASADSLTKKLNNENIKLVALTFHKLAMGILRNNGLKFSVVKEDVLDKIINNQLTLMNAKRIININFITIDCCGLYCSDQDIKYIQEKIFKNSDIFFEIKKTIITFVNMFKSNNYGIENFNYFIKKNMQEHNKYIKKRNYEYLLIIKEIYEEYTCFLKVNNKIDFNDMINYAIKIVDTKGIKKYKYIIVDEYQDTSLAKCELLKVIKEKTNAKLLAVGDDWQSIYRFTGADLTVFTKFEEIFPNTKIFKLKYTYRNSMQLIQILNKFIMKNKSQIPKELISNKHLDKPIIVCYYDNNQEEVLNNILSNLKEPYLILGRNNKDINLVDKKYRKNFMTVHKSKGLESELSVIVNLEDGVLGFPNKIIINDILKYVTHSDSFPYDEERRLFYVALTRTKSYNILLVNKNSPSIFIEEINKYL